MARSGRDLGQGSFASFEFLVVSFELGAVVAVLARVRGVVVEVVSREGRSGTRVERVPTVVLLEGEFLVESVSSGMGRLRLGLRLGVGDLEKRGIW